MEEIVLEAWQMEQQLSIEKDIKVMRYILHSVCIKGVCLFLPRTETREEGAGEVEEDCEGGIN